MEKIIWKELGNGVYVSDKGDIKGRSVNIVNGYGCFSYKRKTRYVHRVVYELFAIPKNHDINHKNGIKSDNRIENLEPLTRSENQLHAFRNGLNNGYDKFGTNNPNYKNGKYLKMSHNEYHRAFERAKLRGLNWKSLTIQDRIDLLNSPRRKRTCKGNVSRL